MNHYVYEITNLVNGKKYIGKRSCKCSIEEDKYMGSGKLIKKAIKKYGIENFEKKILLVCCSEKESFEEERKAIALVKAYENSMYYNIAFGGKGFTSEESKALWNEKSVRDKLERYIDSRDYSGCNNPNSKKVICLNDKKIFNTIREASYTYSVLESQIVANCKDKYLGLNQKKSDERLVFMYFEDYIKTDEKYIKNKIKIAQKSLRRGKHPKSTQIICLNTFEVFDCIMDASEKYGINRAKIGMVCMNKRKSAGKINDKPAKWMYYEDYLKIIR